MRRFLCILAVAFALAGCAPTPAPPRAAPAWSWSLPQPAQCRAGDGGALPLLAERGIGGTGGLEPPLQPLRPEPPSGDRSGPSGGGGAGAGGAPASGIGGTGVSGIVTGFGSVCVNGLEVALDPHLAVSADSGPADAAGLRAGQRVALVARRQGDGLRTGAIGVRHEVIGPVQRVDDRRWVVAGQTVWLGRTTRHIPAAVLGISVAVSGLPLPDGSILATRIDQAAAGMVLLRGTVVGGADGARRIGGLAIAALDAAPGARVAVLGRLAGDRLIVEHAVPDTLESDPVAFFGPGVRRVLVEGFVHGDRAGGLVMAGLVASLPPGIPAPAAALAVVSLSRTPTGVVASPMAASGFGTAGIGPAGIGTAGFGLPGVATPLGETGLGIRGVPGASGFGQPATGIDGAVAAPGAAAPGATAPGPTAPGPAGGTVGGGPRGFGGAPGMGPSGGGGSHGPAGRGASLGHRGGGTH